MLILAEVIVWVYPGIVFEGSEAQRWPVCRQSGLLIDAVWNDDALRRERERGRRTGELGSGVVLLVQLVELELEDEENLLMYWVVKCLEEGMEMEKVLGRGFVVVEVVHSPSSAFLEIHDGLKSGRPSAHHVVSWPSRRC